MNEEAFAEIERAIRMSSVAGRALFVLSAVLQGKNETVSSEKRALQDALAFIQKVRSGRDIFKGRSLSASALEACTAYATALKAVESRAMSLLGQRTFDDVFSDIEGTLKGLAASEPVTREALQLSRQFFSWVMRLASSDARLAVEQSTRTELPQWLRA